MDASYFTPTTHSPCISDTNISIGLIEESIDKLIQFIAPHYLKLVNEPLDTQSNFNLPDVMSTFITDNIQLSVPKIEGVLSRDKRYFLRFSHKITDLASSPINDLLLSLLEKIKNLGFSPTGVNVNLEKGYSYPFAMRLHKDAFETSTIVSWSNHSHWSTYFKEGDQLQPAKIGCFYDAANHYHRSPYYDDFKTDLMDGELSADSYRLFIQFYKSI